MKTTYTLGTPGSTETMTTTMLSLDKQSREEVPSLFYGENTFHFTIMSTLTPFMKDRTAETRKYIQSPRLTSPLMAGVGMLSLQNRVYRPCGTEPSHPF